MALVHPTSTISPTKLEIARQWLAATDWFDGDPDRLKAGVRFSYRFDDPAGEVGVETLLVLDGDRVLQVPLSYRAEELPGADAFFLTHMEHSVLGRRWIYDGLGDPVFVSAQIGAIVTGGQQEDFEVEVDGERQTFPALVQVRGTGSEQEAPGPVELRGHERNGTTSVAHTSRGDLVLPHVAGSIELDGRDGLVGTWPDGPGETVLAVLGGRA